MIFIDRGSRDVEPELEIRSLRVWFGGREVLKGVDLEVPPRRVTTILGPSGSGKSTLLRSINRLLDLVPGARVSGSVLFRGVDVYSDGYDVVELRRRIGMVFQRPNPFPMSIFENVAFGPKVHGVRDEGELRRIVERALRDAGLWEEVKDRLHESAFALSGGQQQRLCIARALAVEPEVLLLDEPTSSLDPGATQRIEELITKLRERYTIVLVTHDVAQAARVSDLVAFLYGGRVVEYGPAEELFERPRHELTERFITGRLLA